MLISIAEFTGGLVAVYILYVLWEFFLFKRISDDPVKGKSMSAIAAYLTASVIYGFGSANGGPWRPVGLILYLIPAVVVLAYGVWRGLKLRDEPTDDEQLEETFS